MELPNNSPPRQGTPSVRGRQTKSHGSRTSCTKYTTQLTTRRIRNCSWREFQVGKKEIRLLGNLDDENQEKQIAERKVNLLKFGKKHSMIYFKDSNQRRD